MHFTRYDSLPLDIPSHYSYAANGIEAPTLKGLMDLTAAYSKSYIRQKVSEYSGVVETDTSGRG